MTSPKSLSATAVEALRLAKEAMAKHGNCWGIEFMAQVELLKISRSALPSLAQGYLDLEAKLAKAVEALKTILRDDTDGEPETANLSAARDVAYDALYLIRGEP